MYRVAPLRNSLVVDERRRHPRHKPTSIIYVALGPGNGGILVNLSAGGASLQAASKLNADTELALDFRLQGGERPIQTVGHVAWLDPSQKEAGISFKDLPGNTERQIAAWIASQEQPIWDSHAHTKPQPMSPARSESLRLPVQASIPAIFPSEKPETARQSFVPILRESVSESPEKIDFASEPHAMPPLPASVPPALIFPARSEARVEPLPEAPLELPTKHYDLRLEPPRLPAAEGEILPRDCLLPDPPVLLYPAAVPADRLVALTPDSFASDLRRRRKFAIGLAASLMAIIALVVTATSINNRQPVADNPEVGTAQPNPQPAAVLPEKAPPTRRAAQRGHALGAKPSSIDSTAADTNTPVPVMRVAIGPVKQDGGLMESLRALFGMDAPNTIDAKAAALPVWTVQHSGFYYCSRSPDFRALEPGAIMTQGQALQSGYQPKLGSYCQ